MKRALVSWGAAIGGVAIEANGESYALRRSRVGPWSAMGRLLAVAMLTLLSLDFLLSITRFPYYSPVTNVEEVALYYTSAGNFVKYGFQQSGFLPDYSTSSDPADHPYVYGHMPPGPDIFIALLLKASGGSYRLVRFVFWVLFLAGMVCYLRFARLILERFDLKGAGFTILFFNPILILRTMDDPQYALFPLWAFLPLLMLMAYYRTGARRFLYLTLGLSLIGSIYLDYLSLFVVVYCWVFLYFTGLIRLEGRHLAAFLGVVAVGVGLHLFQNFQYLGPGLFLKELSMTVTNRIFGVPSKAAMKAFYQSIGMVHHGSTPIVLGGFLSNVWLGFSFPGRVPLVLAGIGCLAWVVARHAHLDREGKAIILPRGEAAAALGYFGGLAVWIAGSLVFSMLMFPAFTQEYGLHGAGLSTYFLAIGATATTLYVLRELIRHRPREFPRTVATGVQAAVVVILVILTGVGLWRAARWDVERFREARSAYQKFIYGKMVDIRARFHGQVYMTNINPVTVGFFAQEAGHGVCEVASLPEAGDIDVSKCHVSYMRREDHYRRVRPRYFFFFSRELFPGFSECLPSYSLPELDRGGDDCLVLMHERLSDRFEKIYDNGLFEVFDLRETE